MSDKPLFVRTDENIFLNVQYIRWVKTIDDCLYVCSKSSGCNKDTPESIHKICKSVNSDNHAKIMNLVKPPYVRRAGFIEEIN